LVAGLESVGEDHYRRQGEGWEVVVTQGTGELVATVTGAAPGGARARLEHLFDLGLDIAAVEQHLNTSPALRPRVAENPGLRLPGCWDAFELVVRAILGQQVSVKGAATLSGRLVDRFGAPTAETLADADVASIGLPKQRGACIQEFARAVLAGDVRFDSSSTDLAAQLKSVKGIGEWTAQYVVMRALHDMDAFPASDLVLMKKSGHATHRSLLAEAESWRPFRAYAAMHIWAHRGTSGVLAEPPDSF
jgi:DNA-3-methyladenine glycosylase II